MGMTMIRKMFFIQNRAITIYIQRKQNHTQNHTQKSQFTPVLFAIGSDKLFHCCRKGTKTHGHLLVKQIKPTKAQKHQSTESQLISKVLH
jgi:hypothetical protein